LAIPENLCYAHRQAAHMSATVKCAAFLRCLSACEHAQARCAHILLLRRRAIAVGLLSGVLLFSAVLPGLAEKKSQAPINVLGQIGERLAQCWQAPLTDPPQTVEVTVRLSFSRTGAVIGAPRVTYVSAPAEAGLREKIKASILEAIKACTPLPFTPSLGAAIAGRMMAIRFNARPLTGKQQII